MKLLDKIQNNQNNTPAPGFQRALVINKDKVRKDPQAEGFQQLKLAVHNRLFESLDVSRLESLAMGFRRLMAGREYGDDDQ